MSVYTCPNCGTQSYQEHYSTSTAKYSPILVLQGVYQFNDPNIHTTYCTCLNCHHDFSVREQNRKILDIIDNGDNKKCAGIN